MEDMDSTDPVLDHLRHLHIPMVEELPPAVERPVTNQPIEVTPSWIPSDEQQEVRESIQKALHADMAALDARLAQAWAIGQLLVRRHVKRPSRALYGHLSAEQGCRIRRELIEADAEEIPRTITVRRLCRHYGVEPQVIERVAGPLW